MPRPPPSLKSRALACIAQREHSRVELRRKLMAVVQRQARLSDALAAPDAQTDSQRNAGTSQVSLSSARDGPGAAWRLGHSEAPGASAEDIDGLLDWLASKDLLSAERFVGTRVNARLQRFGNARIEHELAQHGMDVDAGLARQLKDSEPARAQAVWAKRFGAPAIDAAGKAKQMRFLTARGFSADTVRRVLANASNGTAMNADQADPHTGVPHRRR